MALNPALIPGRDSRGRQGMFPAPYAGEYICAVRDHSSFDVEGPPPYRFKGSGSVFLTNYRLVFVSKKPDRAGVQAFEIPLLFIDQENVKQPIFRANHLKGTCRSVNSSPGSANNISWKLFFTNGGMGTLVPLFYSCLEYIRVASRRRQNIHEEQAPPMASAPPEEKPNKTVASAESEPPPFLASAFVDPNDPTQIFLTQPTQPQSEATQPPKFPVG